MAGAKKCDELLIEIANKLNMIYLSDLTTKVGYFKLKEVFDEIPESKYDLREWQNAANYLAAYRKRAEEPLQTVAEIKHYLLALYATS